jgi:hypothetical protein
MNNKTLDLNRDGWQAFLGNERIFNYAFAPGFLLLIILLGHYGIFFGHSFFIDEDNVLNFMYQQRNSESNGWRPDMGLGMSMFWGDPAVFHAWGIYRWWHELFDDPYLAHNSSIILLLWALSISQFIFLRKVLPNLGKLASLFLALIITFGSLRNEFLFNRPWTCLAIATGPISLLLYDFFRKPHFKHYFIYTLILFFLCALGNTTALLQILITSCIIFISYIFYNFKHGNIIKPANLFRNFFALNLVSGVLLVLLLGWTTYSLIIESQLIDYVRDPDYTADSFFARPDFLFIIIQISKFLHAGILSSWMKPLGLQFLPISHGWNNISPIFPLILIIFIFHKSKNFWEFTSKVIVLTLLFWQTITSFLPGVTTILQSILHSYPLVKFQPVIQVYEIIILGVVVQILQAENLKTTAPRWLFLRKISILFILPYFGIFLLSILIVFFPENLLHLFQTSWGLLTDLFRSQLILELAPLLMKENVKLLHEVMGLESILFYGTSFLIFLLFYISKWQSLFKIQRGRIFCLLVLGNCIFLSWTVYPMNKEPLIWEQQKLTNTLSSAIIKNYDRIATVGSLSCRSTDDRINCIKHKYFGEFGPRRYVVGYRLTSGLDFSATKSFTPKKTASLITSFLEIDGLNAPGVLRTIQQHPAKFSSRLFDYVGVKYIMSAFPLAASKSRELIYSNFQFYLYRNLSAWPTYYLANQIKIFNEMEELYHSKKGVAYISEKDFKSLSPKESKLDQNRSIELTNFKYGDIKFYSSSKTKEFLVFMDAWHPNWKAYIDGIETNVIETNGAFKGVLLPPGDHSIHFLFDNEPFRMGIWVSIITWILFITTWFWLSKRYKNLKV